MFGWAVKKVMKAAELQRVGTSHASFDRYQLTNLTEFAFFCARTATNALRNSLGCARLLTAALVSVLPELAS